MSYQTGYRIYGIHQDEFPCTTESFSGTLSEADYKAIMEEAEKLPLEELEKVEAGERRSDGWITLNSKEHKVEAPPNRAVRKKWQEFIDGVLKKYAPSEKREFTKRSIQGETVKPLSITFSELLKNPQAYDGKRIRLTGYYHAEFEESSFAISKDDLHHFSEALRKYDHCLWLGSFSTFKDLRKVSEANDTEIEFEGTLDMESHGHMAAWMGELARLTAAKPVEIAEKPKSAEKPSK